MWVKSGSVSLRRLWNYPLNVYSAAEIGAEPGRKRDFRTTGWIIFDKHELT